MAPPSAVGRGQPLPRKAQRQRHHRVREDLVGPVQPVHDGLDDLQDRKGCETVADRERGPAHQRERRNARGASAVVQRRGEIVDWTDD